jgi:hypothetical protein
MSTVFEIATYVIAIVFPLFALLDIFRRRENYNGNLLMWTLAVLFLPLLGTVLYYLVGTEKRR